MREAIGLVLMGLGAYGAMLAAVALRVLCMLARRGPAAAEEAFARGDSLSTWWRSGPP